MTKETTYTLAMSDIDSVMWKCMPGAVNDTRPQWHVVIGVSDSHPVFTQPYYFGLKGREFLNVLAYADSEEEATKKALDLYKNQMVDVCPAKEGSLSLRELKEWYDDVVSRNILDPKKVKVLRVLKMHSVSKNH